MALLLSSTTQADKAEKNNVVVQESSFLISKWKDQDEGGALLLKSLEYLDVATLIQRKPISKKWQQLCTKVIDNKCGGQKKKFQSNNELRQAVRKYSPGDSYDNRPVGTPMGVENIASTYGYPINNWDVSNIKDFSYVFNSKSHFNEAIRSWDTSNGTTMEGMFWDATSFNQDISSWDVSNATNMRYMFEAAMSFNQYISSWDVSKVTNMRFMFSYASSFNQPIGSWDVSNVIAFHGMFRRCPIKARQFPWFREEML